MVSRTRSDQPVEDLIKQAFADDHLADFQIGVPMNVFSVSRLPKSHSYCKKATSHKQMRNFLLAEKDKPIEIKDDRILIDKCPAY